MTELISLIYLFVYIVGVVAVTGLLYSMIDEWRSRA
jgi:hypothetical protein